MAYLSCTRCGGYAQGGHGCFYWGLVVCTFPIGLLLLLIKPTYTCPRCGFMFKA